MVLGLYHFGTLMIHESAIVKSPSPRNDPDWRDYEVYQRCIGSITAWLDQFFSISLNMYTLIPFGVYSQLFYIMVCLHRITTAKDTAWDPSATRDMADLMATVDRIIHLFEQLEAVGPSRSPEDGEEDGGVIYGVKKLQHLKMVWQNELLSMDDGGSASHETNMADGAHELFPTMSMDFFGSDTLPDLLDFSWQ